ncbi:MAG: MerR family transcriptional regulator [Lachnospiraceae bacterium]|nr:MerR family transcriptional regulator [Lachnospiraceae bacterium]
MQLNEVCRRVELSKRAVKYYEEQGLLSVGKDVNGYRNYTEENVAILQKIAVYRKLGISIRDIRCLLESSDDTILEEIYETKAAEMDAQEQELRALRRFIDDHDAQTAADAMEFRNIAEALKEMIPGFYGQYFMNHFLPYLQIRITTPEQKAAYRNIIEFWDNTTIRVPLFMRFSGCLIQRLTPEPSMKAMTERIDVQIRQYLNPTDEEYEKLKQQIRKNVRLKNSLLYRYHPAYISQRRFMKQLQDKGYNDIFIPNMIALSPKYREYHEALESINRRVCRDLGLYYDSKYNLIMKK